MPDVQRRLPGVKWSETSTKQSRPRPTPPSGGPLPGAPEGQMFDTGPFTRPRDEPQEPGWGVAHGRPNYLGQGPEPQPVAHQAPLTRAPLGYQAYPKEHPPEFAQKGIGKYFLRNANGFQFNKPAIHQGVQNLVQAGKDANFFMHAGMGEALGYTVGLGTSPSHRSDDINTRRHAAEREQAMGGNHGVAGINPGHVQGYHAGHPTSAFEPGLSW